MAAPVAGIYSHLKAASQLCRVRGLVVSSNWAAEQLLGCAEYAQLANVDDAVNLFDLQEVLPTKEVGVALMGSTLITLGEYQRCANLFVDSATKELKVSSPLAVFLWAYSQYLAGEKTLSRSKKEKSKAGLESQDDYAGKKVKSRNILDPTQHNAHVPLIHHALRSLHQQNRLDGFLLYVYAIVTDKYYSQYGKPLENAEDAYEIFKQSVVAYPWNWSCWMDLATYCLENHRPIPSFQDLQATSAAMSASSRISTANPSPGGGYSDMDYLKLLHAFFITHVFLEKHRGDLALQVLKGLHSTFPTSLHICCQIGLAYYSQRLFDRAQDCFEYVRSQDPCRLQHMDTFSNILYVKEKMPELSHLAHELMKVEKYSPEVCCVVGNYYSLKGFHDKAVLYFQRSLSLRADYLPAWTLMGHEFVELRNMANAITCYRQAIAIYRYDYRPWYGLGQTYEILHLYQYAVHYFQKAATLQPFDARMWSAVGNCYLKLGMKYDALLVLERAVKAGDREGIATRDLARLYRDDNEEDRAAELYYKYLTCNVWGEMSSPLGLSAPTTAGALPGGGGMASTSPEGSLFPPNLSDLVALLHSPMASELFAHTRENFEATLESEQAEALLYLALYFQARNDPVLTDFCCARLLGFQGPEGEEARLIMKSLRAEVTATVPTPRRGLGMDVEAQGVGVGAGGGGGEGLGREGGEGGAERPRRGLGEQLGRGRKDLREDLAPITPVSAPFDEHSRGSEMMMMMSMSMSGSASHSMHKFVLSPPSDEGLGSASRAHTVSRHMSDGSTRSAVSHAGFDPFARYLHMEGAPEEGGEGELDLSAAHLLDTMGEDAAMDLSVALGRSFEEADLSAIAPLPMESGGSARRGRPA